MESRLSDRKLKPLPPDLFRHQDSAIAPPRERQAFMADVFKIMTEHLERIGGE